MAERIREHKTPVLFFIIIGVLLAVLVSLGAASLGMSMYPVDEGAIIPKFTCPADTCYDTDGANINVKGRVYGRENDDKFSFWDSCYSINKVREYTCTIGPAGTKNPVTEVINCPIGYECDDGKCVLIGPPDSCSDSDGGYNVEVFGEVSGYINGQAYSYTDICLDNDLVLEYYCSGTTPMGSNHSCALNGSVCSGGECVSGPSCTDSDGGINYYEQGTVFEVYQNGTNKTFTDFCSVNNRVIEYYCYDNHAAATDQKCDLLGDYVCEDGACVSNQTNNTLIVFVSPGSYNGRLGNTPTEALNFADWVCENASIQYGYDGTYRAWLSNENIDAKDRINDGVFVNINGTIIANSKADLLNGSIDAAIGGGYVWTGTGPDGTNMIFGNLTAIPNCDEWTSSNQSLTGGEGIAGYTNSYWTYYRNYNCNNQYRSLYCFQVA